MNYKLTLLTHNEYIENLNVIPHIEDAWWLRNGQPSFKAYYALNKCVYAYFVEQFLGVRPALLISKPEKVYEYGSEITVGRYKWTVLRSDEKECYALCTEIIATRRYDSKSSDYETSEIKHWLDEFRIFDFCKYCFDCTCDPDGELTPENDFSSRSIGTSTEGHRITFSAGWGKPPRIESEYWNGKIWVTVSSYTPEFCPNCGRKINKEAYKR